MTPQDIHHLAAAYALDAVTDGERQVFEAHYPNCEICSREVAEFRETAANLASGAGAAPPPDLRQQIMTAVAQSQQVPVIVPDKVIDLADRRPRTNWGSMLIGAAAAAVIAVIGTVAALRSDTGSHEMSELLAAPDAVVTTLDGEGGTIRVVWSADRSRLGIVGAGLDDPGPARTYELWLVLGAGEVSPAGLFEPDDTGGVETIVSIDDPSDITGFGVTIEPDGGSPQPTSAIIFSGTV